MKKPHQSIPTNPTAYVDLDVQIAYAEMEVRLNDTTPGSMICKWDFILDSLRELKRLRAIETK
jgi:hypothetical protein